jgi:NAD(P)H-hydrate epimerase
MRVATAAQMRQLDQITIHDRGVPSTVLMERAAQGVAGECLALWRDCAGKRAAVLCGSGNNGGDGVAVARLLQLAGLDVRAFLVGKREKMTEDCREMERRFGELGGVLEPFDPESAQQAQWIQSADLCVDALFGIGLNAPLRGSAAQAVALINASAAQVVAVDIPSGVASDTSCILGSAVRADKTVTFTLPKLGLLVGDGALCTGTLVVHDIGIPADLLDSMQYSATSVDAQLVRAWLPERPVDGHKGTFGKCYLLSGSVGYTGAPILASRAAMRSGTGLVFLGVPESIYTIAAVKSDEAMPSPLPAGEDGTLSEEALVPVLEKMAGCDAALLGPGLGRSDGVTRIIEQVMDTVQYPLVLDADGINAIAGHMDVLYRRRESPTIVTPHDGEFARMGGDLSDGDRVSAARRFSMTFGCLLVLKGHRTIISLPDGEVFVNTTGNAGMAKGGSGDVLSGILVSLLAQGLHPVKAAVCAVWIHGRAGDLCKAELGERGMTPSDLIAHLPQVFKELE